MQKSLETEDLRVRRTRKMLQDALIELTVEKGFAAVTVRDITERAMVNRSTFYRHYLDKYDLLEQYVTEVKALAEQDDALDGERELTPGGAPAGLVNLLEHVRAHSEFYRVMLGQMGDPVFTERFRQSIARRIHRWYSRFQTEPDAPPFDLKLTYVSCAGVGAILWWLEDKNPCTAEQLALWLSQLARSTMGVDAKAAGEVET